MGMLTSKEEGEFVFERSLCLLGTGHGGEGVNSVDMDQEWEEIISILDSGAADSVGPASMATSVPVRESQGSRQGQKFFTADGTRLPNQGDKMIQAYTCDMQPVTMRYQVAEVTKPLCSVGKVTDCGNMVCFDSQGGVIYHRKTGHTTPFTREQGVYVLRTWVRKPSNSSEDFPRQGWAVVKDPQQLLCHP